MASFTFEPGFSDGGLAIGEYDRVAVMVWRGQATPARIRSSGDGFAAIAARLPGPVSLLAVIEEGSSPPTVTQLPIVVRAFDRFVGVMTAAVAVLEERAAVSTLIDTLANVHALRRQPSPTKFCSDHREAVAWLAVRHPHADPDPIFRAGLLEAVALTRAHLAPEPGGPDPGGTGPAE